MDDFAVPDRGQYTLTFEEGPLTYTVVDEIFRTVAIDPIIGKATSVRYTYVDSTTFVLRPCTRADAESPCEPSGEPLVQNVDYKLNAEFGTVTVYPESGVGPEDLLLATLRYSPVYKSDLVRGEEANLVFDGLHVFVIDHVEN